MTPAIDVKELAAPERGEETRSSVLHAVVAGLVVAALVVAGRLTGVLDGAAGLALAALLLALAPFSRRLSRRLLIGGGLVIGWMPLLWWLPAPGHGIGWVTPALAMSAGALAAWPFSGAGPARRARLLLPRFSTVDALPVLTFALGIWQTWPLVNAASGDRSLTLLMKSNWDHVTHYDMVEMIRRHGQVVPMLDASPDGSAWVGATYPEHFHAFLVGVMELVSGPEPGTPSAELLAYGQGLGLVLSLLAALLVAGVVSLPTLRRRPLVTWPLATLVAAAYVVGPGAAAISNAFPNFVFAAGTAALAALAAAATFGRARLVSVLLLGGLVVATAHSWLPLAPLAGVAACVPFLRVRRVLAGTSRGRRAALVTAAGASVLLSLAAVLVLHDSGATDALNLNSSPPQYSMSRLLTITLGACAAAAAAWSLRRDAGSRRALELAAVPLTGLLMTLALGSYQLITAGELSYYFGKLADGVSLVSYAVLATGLAHLAVRASRQTEASARNRVGARLATVIPVGAAVLATVVATQFFGYVGPQPPTPVTDLAPMPVYRAAGVILTASPSGESQRLLAAGRIAAHRPFGTTSYVAALPGDPIPALAAQWQLALSQTWSATTGAGPPGILSQYGAAFVDMAAATEATRLILDGDGRVAVVVAPEQLAEIQGGLPRSMRSRVITW